VTEVDKEGVRNTVEAPDIEKEKTTTPARGRYEEEKARDRMGGPSESWQPEGWNPNSASPSRR
jgi:hypothetical protein